MNVAGSASNLVQSLKELSAHWQQTKEHWRDAKSAEFEREYLDTLPEHIARAMTVMSELEAVLRKVRSDCE